MRFPCNQHDGFAIGCSDCREMNGVRLRKPSKRQRRTVVVAADVLHALECSHWMPDPSGNTPGHACERCVALMAVVTARTPSRAL